MLQGEDLARLILKTLPDRLLAGLEEVVVRHKWDVSPSPGKKELSFTSFELLDHSGHGVDSLNEVKSPVQILGVLLMPPAEGRWLGLSLQRGRRWKESG